MCVAKRQFAGSSKSTTKTDMSREEVSHQFFDNFIVGGVWSFTNFCVCVWMFTFRYKWKHSGCEPFMHFGVENHSRGRRTLVGRRPGEHLFANQLENPRWFIFHQPACSRLRGCCITSAFWGMASPVEGPAYS